MEICRFCLEMQSVGKNKIDLATVPIKGPTPPIVPVELVSLVRMAGAPGPASQNRMADMAKPAFMTGPLNGAKTGQEGGVGIESEIGNGLR